MKEIHEEEAYSSCCTPLSTIKYFLLLHLNGEDGPEDFFTMEEMEKVSFRGEGHGKMFKEEVHLDGIGHHLQVLVHHKVLQGFLFIKVMEI